MEGRGGFRVAKARGARNLRTSPPPFSPWEEPPHVGDGMTRGACMSKRALTLAKCQAHVHGSVTASWSKALGPDLDVNPLPSLLAVRSLASTNKGYYYYQRLLGEGS